MMATRSREREHDECLHHDADEETSSCSCSFIGFKRNQVFDYSLVSEDSEELFEINLKEALDTTIEDCDCDCESTVFSLDIHNWKDDVYVAVDDHGDSSMEALSWALKHAVTPSTTTVYLIHVFPEIKFIPTPLGKIPRSNINPEYVNMYLTQERGKRKLLLQKFIDLCVDSKVKVEVMLIEGDNIAKAIVDVVGDLNIRKLVIGTAKSNLRKSGSGRRNAIADKVLKDAQESCDVKIICEGTEVVDHMIRCTSSSFTDSTTSSRVTHEEDDSRGFVPFWRFLSNPMWLLRSRHLSPR